MFVLAIILLIFKIIRCHGVMLSPRTPSNLVQIQTTNGRPKEVLWSCLRSAIGTMTCADSRGKDYTIYREAD